MTKLRADFSTQVPDPGEQSASSYVSLHDVSRLSRELTFHVLCSRSKQCFDSLAEVLSVGLVRELVIPPCMVETSSDLIPNQGRISRALWQHELPPSWQQQGYIVPDKASHPWITPSAPQSQWDLLEAESPYHPQQ